VVHLKVTEYPFKGSYVLLTVAEMLPTWISPGSTVAKRGVTDMTASIRKQMGLIQRILGPTNLGKGARADVIVISFTKRNCCRAAAAARWAAELVKESAGAWLSITA
jgi:hypothetical protein